MISSWVWRIWCATVLIYCISWIPFLFIIVFILSHFMLHPLFIIICEKNGCTYKMNTQSENKEVIFLRLQLHVGLGMEFFPVVCVCVYLFTNIVSWNHVRISVRLTWMALILYYLYRTADTLLSCFSFAMEKMKLQNKWNFSFAFLGT